MGRQRAKGMSDVGQELRPSERPQRVDCCGKSGPVAVNDQCPIEGGNPFTHTNDCC